MKHRPHALPAWPHTHVFLSFFFSFLAMLTSTHADIRYSRCQQLCLILLTLACNQRASAGATCSHTNPHSHPHGSTRSAESCHQHPPPRHDCLCAELPRDAALRQMPRERNAHFPPTDLQLLFSTAPRAPPARLCWPRPVQLAEKSLLLPALIQSCLSLSKSTSPSQRQSQQGILSIFAESLTDFPHNFMCFSV